MTYAEISKKFEQKKTKHLIASVVLDFLGMSTYLIPILGEAGDIIFAPIYGIAIFSMYKMRLGSAAVGGVTGFVEELLPGTDIVPTATVMWAYTYVARRESTFKKFLKREGKDREMVQRVAQGLSPNPSIWTRIENLFTGNKTEPYTFLEEEEDNNTHREGNDNTRKLQ